MKNSRSFLIVIIALLTFNPIRSQIQVGEDIDGEALDDQSGNAVALASDGSRVAIGSPYNDAAGTDAGHVRVYDLIGSAWVQVGNDIDGEAAFDESGESVAISSDGSRVAIGAPFNDGTAPLAGHVRVYDLIGSTWTQVGDDIDGNSQNNQSGHEVSLSSDGNRVAIGSPRSNQGASGAGHVQVYDLVGGTWTQVGEDIEGEEVNDESGSTLSLSSDGNRLAIGAPLSNGNGSYSGQTRIFEWDGSSWNQMGADINGENAGDLDASVSLSSDGNRLVIGGGFSEVNGINSGVVRTFEWDGSSWIQMGQSIYGENATDRFGVRVSISSDGNRIAAGAFQNDGNGSDSGHVRVFDWDGANWTQVGVNINGEASVDFSGRAISLSPDANRIAIGAPRNDGNGAESGHVRIYEFMTSSVIGSMENDIIKVYPNPTNGIINLLGFEDGTIKIMDSFGKLILIKEEITEPELDLSELAKGIYFINITENETLIHYGKIIIQ